MAAAGVDASNVEPGTIVLLPVDPDASARALRAALADRAGVDVAVVVTDTAGRAWREGQTDIAVGAAGLRVLDDLAGRTDPYGNLLAVTAPAVADEIAGAAELASGKLGAGRSRCCAAVPTSCCRPATTVRAPPGCSAGGGRPVRPRQPRGRRGGAGGPPRAARGVRRTGAGRRPRRPAGRPAADATAAGPATR